MSEYPSGLLAVPLSLLAVPFSLLAVAFSLLAVPLLRDYKSVVDTKDVFF